MIQEFRVGNLVYLKTYPDQYETIKIHNINSTMNVVGFDKRWTAMSNIDPIPLTPEILEKVGFYIVNHIGGYSFWTLDRKGKNRDNPPIDIYENRTLHNGYSVKHCKHLHELQNLFWCLTGEELTINL